MGSNGKKIGIGINGYGSIGRCVAKVALLSDDVELVAVNDLVLTIESLALALKIRTQDEIIVKDSKTILVGQKPIAFFAIKNPEDIPWGETGANYVVETTGVLTDKDSAAAHLKGGAKKVIITAPSKDAPMFIVGVNEQEYKLEYDVISSANCRTNCFAPLAKVIQDRFGIVELRMSTLHSTIGDPHILDGPPGLVWYHRCRVEDTMVLENLLPFLNGKLKVESFELISKLPDISTCEIHVKLAKNVSYEDVELAIMEESNGKLVGILGYADGSIPAIDYLEDNRSCIYFNAKFDDPTPEMRTKKLVALYNNEWGYSNRVVDLVRHIASKMASEGVMRSAGDHQATKMN